MVNTRLLIICLWLCFTNLVLFSQKSIYDESIVNKNEFSLKSTVKEYDDPFLYILKNCIICFNGKDDNGELYSGSFIYQDTRLFLRNYAIGIVVDTIYYTLSTEEYTKNILIDGYCEQMSVPLSPIGGADDYSFILYFRNAPIVELTFYNESVEDSNLTTIDKPKWRIKIKYGNTYINGLYFFHNC